MAVALDVTVVKGFALGLDSCSVRTWLVCVLDVVCGLCCIMDLFMSDLRVSELKKSTILELGL